MKNILAALIVLSTVSACPAQEGEPYKAVPAFPELSFENPLFLAAPPDGTDRIYVVEQAGRVLWFENAPEAREAREALDIRDKVRTVHNEEGLLGLAFHPKFKEKRFVFLQYSASFPRRNIVSRFTAGADGAFDP